MKNWSDKWIREAGKLSSLGAVAAFVLLTGCNQNPTTDPPKTLAAPQNVLAIGDDSNVTVVWDALTDSKVKGYNVYQDGEKVNSDPISNLGASTKQARAADAPRRLRFVVKNVAADKLHKFGVKAVDIDGKEGDKSEEPATKPLVCERYKLSGTDMGAYYQNIKLSKGATNVTTATVQVNGTGIAFNGGSSIYQGTLAAAVPVGGNVDVLSAVGDCLVYAHDVVPESAVLIAPAAGANANVNADLPVTWTSGSNPDRFAVVATWLINPTTGTFWRSSDLPGTARTFSIPSGTLPSGKTVKIRVYAYNDGEETFIGAYESGSKMAIRNADEGGHDISTVEVAPDPVGTPGVSWGDPHLITLDQLGYEFQPVGEYDLSFSSGKELQVQARHQPWGGSTSVSVNTAIATKMNGQKVGLYLNPPAGQSPLRVGDTGVPTDVPATGLDLGAGFKVTLSGSSYTFSYPGGDKLKVNVNGAYMDAYVYPATTRVGQMRGLLGNMDGDLGNEFIKRDGGAFVPLTNASSTHEYANSWSVPSLEDSLFVYDAKEQFGGFNDPNFPSSQPQPTPDEQAAAKRTCEGAGVKPKNLENCIIDVALTGDKDFGKGAADVQEPIKEIKPDVVAKPDLVVLDGSVKFGACRPYSIYAYGKVTVKNIGTAASPAILDKGIVQIVDAADAGLGAGYRGQGVGLQSLAPGETATVDINVAYPFTMPVGADTSHDYVARVDFGNWIDESNESNNVLGTKLFLNIPAGACKNHVAIVHSKIKSVAQAYESGLENKGFDVTLLDAATLSDTNIGAISKFDLIMIDSESGNLNTWDGGSAAANAIRLSKRPVLGIGEGGYSYLGTFKSPVGWANGWHSGAGEMNYSSIPHASQSGPFAVSIAAGLVDMATVNMPYVAIYLPQTSSNLELVGRQTTDANHYTAVLNTKPTASTGWAEALWGFSGKPYYTQNGWNAFSDLGWYMIK
jgi:CARDB/von Willebrand factor type D domain